MVTFGLIIEVCASRLDVSQWFPTVYLPSPCPLEPVHSLYIATPELGLMKAKGKKPIPTARAATREVDAAPPRTPSPPMTREQSMHAALKQSIVGGMLLDTRFHLFSRRKPSGVIDKPRTVFAISTTLIEASLELDKLLTGGFSESVLSDIFEENTEIEGQEVTDAQYGYESNSDLEDDDVEIELGTADSGNQPAGMSAAPDAVLKKADIRGHFINKAVT